MGRPHRLAELVGQRVYEAEPQHGQEILVARLAAINRLSKQQQVAFATLGSIEDLQRAVETATVIYDALDDDGQACRQLRAQTYGELP